MIVNGKKGIDKQRLAQLQELSSLLQIPFRNYELLHQALIHTSFANESKEAGVQHNERLEFLGDAVLDLVVGEVLFKQFPQLPEGELTKARARIVCEPTLANSATKLCIGSYLLLGKGETASGGRQRISILADAFEAIIGAVYLDSGYANAYRFIVDHLQGELNLVKSGEYANDHKTLLQEVIQRQGEQKISYEVVNEEGPDHDKTFMVAVCVNGKLLGSGQGKSKKEAEQNAAKQALEKFNGSN